MKILFSILAGFISAYIFGMITAEFISWGVSVWDVSQWDMGSRFVYVVFSLVFSAMFWLKISD